MDQREQFLAAADSHIDWTSGRGTSSMPAIVKQSCDNCRKMRPQPRSRPTPQFHGISAQLCANQYGRYVVPAIYRCRPGISRCVANR